MTNAIKFWLGILVLFLILFFTLANSILITAFLILMLNFFIIYLLTSLILFDYEYPYYVEEHGFGEYNFIYLIVKFNKYLNKFGKDE